MEPSSESSKHDINTFFGKCRCCLEYGYMKSMWSEYERDGFHEIYGEMLMETFSVTWESLDDSQDYICEACVLRLRDAYDFKKEVLASEQLMYEDFDDLDESLCKIEVLEDFEDCGQKNVPEDDSEEKPSVSETEYYEVEYLEDEIELNEASDLTTIKVEHDQPKKEPRLPQRKKRGDMRRVYKNYSAEQLQQCLDAVRDKSMSISEASKLFRIPRKTICVKLNEQNKKKPVTPDDIQKAINHEKQQVFIAEIKKVLSLTNALPFKIKNGKYFCPYCYRESFDDPDDMRIHIRSSHEEIWLKNIDYILRPQFLNEILRIDIENLQCRMCDVPIKTWNDMFSHLKEVHDIEMDQSYTRLVPFKLRREFMHCALCEERFVNFSFLDNHMNSHYCNYMCSDCGDSFLTETRLKHHIQIHKTGRYSCDQCGKVFTLEKYMKKHQAMVHKKYKIFKCSYCAERFHAEFERHVHVVEYHKEKVRIFTCEICGKTFDWRPYYLAHLRKVHSNNKKNKCSYCAKGFVSRHEWKMHEQRHTGSGKHFCTQCGKNFVTMMELRSHLKRHFKEDGFIS